MGRVVRTRGVEERERERERGGGGRKREAGEGGEGWAEDGQYTDKQKDKH